MKLTLNAWNYKKIIAYCVTNTYATASIQIWCKLCLNSKLHRMKERSSISFPFMKILRLLLILLIIIRNHNDFTLKQSLTWPIVLPSHSFFSWMTEEQWWWWCKISIFSLWNAMEMCSSSLNYEITLSSSKMKRFCVQIIDFSLVSTETKSIIESFPLYEQRF